jgi:uncharacterized protein YlxW (UPF0749 family)
MNTRFTPALLITGTFVGALLFTQFNTDVPIDSTFPADELEARETVLKSYKDEQSYLQSRIVFLRNRVEELKADIETQTDDTNISQLNILQEDIGLSEKSGSGIEIILDDPSSGEHLVQASDLRDLVNLLFAANADAIAINNQRIIATSPIASVGETILVNNTFVSPPFVLTAVGESEALTQRIYSSLALKGLYRRKNELGLVFDVVGKSLITIPIYNGELNTDYLNLVE